MSIVGFLAKALSLPAIVRDRFKSDLDMRNTPTEIVYKDPFGYPRVSLHDLVVSDVDALWINEEGPGSEVGNDEYSRLFHRQADPPICENTLPERAAVKPASFILKRHNVLLSGYRCYIGKDSTFCLDVKSDDENETNKITTKLAGAEQFDHELSGLVAGGRRGRLRTDLSNKEFIEIDSPVVSLTSDEAPNYGSFLVKIIPKISLIAKLPNNIRILVPLYFDGAEDLLRLSGIDSSRIIRHEVDKVYALKEVYILSIRNTDFWLDNASRAFFESLRLRYGGAPRENRRIFISRARFHADKKAFHDRRLTNEDEVAVLLTSFGFETVYPELLSISQQITLFSSASVILGPSGSGLFNAIFCHPGTILIDIESEPHWVRNHVRLFASLALRYAIFEGEPSTRETSNHHVPFRVDIEALRSSLQAIGRTQVRDSKAVER